MTLPTGALYSVQALAPIVALSLAQAEPQGDWGPVGWGMLIAAIALGIAQVIAAWAAAKKAIAPVAAEVAVISKHVNSENDRNNNVIASQKLQIDLQRETIEELKAATALLAQAKAIADTSAAITQAAVAGATTPPSPAAPAAEHLQAIETNTKETAVNTKQTDAAVKELKDTAKGEA